MMQSAMTNEEPILIRVFNGTKLFLSTKRSLAGIKEEASLKWEDGRIPRIYSVFCNDSLRNEGQFQNWLSLMERRRNLSPDLAAIFPGERYITTSEPEQVVTGLIEETRIIRVRWGEEFFETTKQSLADIEEEASLKWSNGQMIPLISTDYHRFGNEGAFQYYFKKFCRCVVPIEAAAIFPRDTYQSWKERTEKINERFILDGLKEIRVKRGEEIMVTRFRLLDLIRQEAFEFWGHGRLGGPRIYSETAQAVLRNEGDFQRWLNNTWKNCNTTELLAVYPGEKLPTQHVQHKIISPDRIIRVRHGEEVMLSSRRSLADIQADASLKWTESDFVPHIIPRIIIDNESQQEIKNEFDFDEWLEDWEENPTDLVAVFPSVWNCVTSLLSRVMSALSYDKDKND